MIGYHAQLYQILHSLLLVNQPIIHIPFCTFFSSHHHQYAMLFILCCTPPYSVCHAVFYLLHIPLLCMPCCIFSILPYLIPYDVLYIPYSEQVYFNILFLTMHYSVRSANHSVVHTDPFCMQFCMFYIPH